CQYARHQRGDAEPENEAAGRDDFDGEQDHAENDPAPGAEGCDETDHVGGTVRGRAGGAGGVSGRWLSTADFAISAMPASEPMIAVASTGRISVFWFGAEASFSSARTYL